MLAINLSREAYLLKRLLSNRILFCLIQALAKESGKFEKELRYPGEDDVYENPKMDALKL